MAEVRAALFDVDGTLIDSNALHVSAWREACADAGHEVAPERIAGLIGMGGDKLVPALLPEAGEDEAKAIADRHDALFKSRYLARARPFPAARELVARVHGSGRLVVLASSSSEEEVDHYIDLLGIRPFVVTRTSGDEVKESKPAPDIFATALGKADVPAAAALAIGDAPYDAEGAAKSGIRTVALLSGGFDRARLEGAGAIAVYADAAELLARFDDSPLAR